MTAWSSGLPQPALVAMLILALVPILVHAAPLAEQSTEMDPYPVADSTGCYYNFQHYDEGDRILTNEPCLNCTCHNRMLMCYLRVCPFTKAIGQDCTVEKRTDQCCPVITCPEVPVQLLPSTTPSTALGHINEYGCFIDNLFYSDGARVPSNPNKPCELCYCIRNRTACVMQECTLNIEGCRPVYLEGVCCPAKYDCDHPEQNLLETTTTTKPTTGLIFTTTMQPGTTECVYKNEVYADGALIKKDTPCEHCYCMKGDIVCAVQECSPTPLDKVNCTAVPPRGNQCCPDTYDCDNIIEQELTTLSYGDYTTVSPGSPQPVENEEENELLPTLHPSFTGKPFEGEQSYTYAPPELTEIPEIEAQATAQPELGQGITGRPSETEQTQPHTYLPPTTEIPLTRAPELEAEATGHPEEVPAGTGKPFEAEQTEPHVHVPSASEGPLTELPESGVVTTGQPELTQTVTGVPFEQTSPHAHVPPSTEGSLTELPEGGVEGEQTEHAITEKPSEAEPFPHVPSTSEGSLTHIPEGGIETTGEPGLTPTITEAGEQAESHPQVPSVSEGPSTETAETGAASTGKPETITYTPPGLTEIPEIEAQATSQPELGQGITGRPSETEQTQPHTYLPPTTEIPLTRAPEIEGQATGRPEEVQTITGKPVEGEQTHVPSASESPSTEMPEYGPEVTGPPVEAQTITSKPVEGEQTHVPSASESPSTEITEYGPEVTGRPVEAITSKPVEGEQTHVPSATESPSTKIPEYGPEVTGPPVEAQTITSKPFEGEQTHGPSASESPSTEIPEYGPEVTGQPQEAQTSTDKPVEGEQTRVPSASESPSTEIPEYRPEVTGQPEEGQTSTGKPVEGEQTHVPSASESPSTEIPEYRPEVTGQPEEGQTSTGKPVEGEQTHVPSASESPSTEIPEYIPEVTGQPEEGQTSTGKPVEGEQTPPGLTEIPEIEAQATAQPELGQGITGRPSETEQTQPHTYLPPTTEIPLTIAPELEGQPTGRPEEVQTITGKPVEGEQTHVPSASESPSTEIPEYGPEPTGRPEEVQTITGKPVEGEQTHVPTLASESPSTEIPEYGPEVTGRPQEAQTIAGEPVEGEQTHVPSASESPLTELPEYGPEVTGRPQEAQTITSKPIEGEQTESHTHVPSPSESPLSETPESEAQITTGKPVETEPTLPHTYLPPTTESSFTEASEIPDIEAQATGQPETTHPSKETEHKQETESPVITEGITPKEQEPGLHTPTTESAAPELPEDHATEYPSVLVTEGEQKITEQTPELTTEGARVPGEGHVPKIEEATEQPEGQTPQGTAFPTIYVTEESHIPGVEQSTEGVPHISETEKPSIPVTEGEEYIPQGTEGLPYPVTELPAEGEITSSQPEGTKKPEEEEEEEVTEKQIPSEEQATKEPFTPSVTEGVHIPSETEGPLELVTEGEHTTAAQPQTELPQVPTEPVEHVTEGEMVTGEHVPVSEKLPHVTEGPEIVTEKEYISQTTAGLEIHHTDAEGQVTESHPGITKEPPYSVTEEVKPPSEPYPIEGGAQVTEVPGITTISGHVPVEGQATERIPSATEQPQGVVTEGEYVSQTIHPSEGHSEPTKMPATAITEGEHISTVELPGVTKIPTEEHIPTAGQPSEGYPHVTEPSVPSEGQVTEELPGLTKEPVSLVTEGEHVPTKQQPQEVTTEKQRPEVTEGEEHATAATLSPVTIGEVQVTERFPEISGEPEQQSTESSVHITEGRPEEGEHVSTHGYSTEGFVHVTEEPVVAATVAEDIPAEGHPSEGLPEVTEEPVVSITQAGIIPSQEQSTIHYPQTIESDQTQPHTYLPPTTEIPITKIPEGATGQPEISVTEGEEVKDHETEVPEEYKPTEIGGLPEVTEEPIGLVTDQVHEDVHVTKEPVIATEKVSGVTEEPVVAATEGVHVSVEGEPTEEAPYVTEKEHVPVEGVPAQVTEEPAVVITGPQKIPSETEGYPTATDEPVIHVTETKQPLEGHSEVTIKSEDVTTETGHIPTEGHTGYPQVTEGPTVHVTEGEHIPVEAGTTAELPQITEKPISTTGEGEVPTEGIPQTTQAPLVIEGGITEIQPIITEGPGIVTEGEGILEIHLPEGAASTLAPTEHVTKIPVIGPEGEQVPVQVVTEGGAPSTKLPSSEIDTHTETEALSTEQPLPPVTQEVEVHITTESEGEHTTYHATTAEHIPVHVTPEGEISVTKLPPILQPEEHITGYETTKRPSTSETETHIPVEIKPEGEGAVTKVPPISATEQIQITEGEVSATEQAPVVSSTEGEPITAGELFTEGKQPVESITEGGLPEGGFETTKQPVSVETQTQGEAQIPEQTEGEFVPVEVLQEAEGPATAHPGISVTPEGQIPGEGKEPEEGYTTQQPLPTHEGVSEHATEEIPEHGVPGEGSCLVDGQTYGNNSSVPPINHCQTSCKCLSSILQCETVTCSPAPSNLHNCMPVYQGPDSCCPTYSCTVPETPEIESDSHKMEGTTTYQTPTEQPITIPISILPPEIETTLKPETEVPVGSTERLPEGQTTLASEHFTKQPTESLPTIKPEEVPSIVEGVTEHTPEAHITESTKYPSKPLEGETGGEVTEHAVSTEHTPEVEVTKGVEHLTSKPGVQETPVTESVEYTAGYPSKPVTGAEIHVEEGQSTEPVTGYPNTTPEKSFEDEDHTTSRPSEIITEGQVTMGVEYATGLPEHETEYVPGGIEHITGIPSQPTVIHEGSTPSQVTEEHLAEPTEHPEYVTESVPAGEVTEGVVHITGTSKPSELVTKPEIPEEQTTEAHVTEALPHESQAPEISEGPAVPTEQAPESPVTEGVEHATGTPSKPFELVTEHTLPEEQTPAVQVTESVVHEGHIPEYTEGVTQPTQHPELTTEPVSAGQVTEELVPITGTPSKPSEFATESVVSEEGTPEAHLTTGKPATMGEQTPEGPVTESVEYATGTPQKPYGEEGQTTEQVTGYPNTTPIKPFESEDHTTAKSPDFATGLPEHETEVPGGIEHITRIPSEPSESVTEHVVPAEGTPEIHVTEGLPQKEHVPGYTEGPTGETQATVTDSFEHGSTSKPSEVVTEHEVLEEQTPVVHVTEGVSTEQNVPEYTEAIAQPTEYPELVTEKVPEGQITEGPVHITGAPSKPSEFATEPVIHEEETPEGHVTERLPHEEYSTEITESSIDITGKPLTEEVPHEGPITEGIEHVTGIPSKSTEAVTEHKVPEEQTTISYVTEISPHEEHTPGVTEGTVASTKHPGLTPEEVAEGQVTEGGVHVTSLKPSDVVTEQGLPEGQTTSHEEHTPGLTEGSIQTGQPEVVTKLPIEGQVTEGVEQVTGTTTKPSELITEHVQVPEEQTPVSHVTEEVPPKEHEPEATDVPSRTTVQPELASKQPHEGEIIEGVDQTTITPTKLPEIGTEPQGQTSTAHVTEKIPQGEQIPEATGQPELATEPAPEGVEHVTGTVTEGIETGYPSKPSESITEGAPHGEGQTTEPVTGYPNTTPVKSFEYEDHTTSKPSEGQVTTGVEYATGLPEHETEIPGGIEHITGISSKPSEIVTEPAIYEESTPSHVTEGAPHEEHVPDATEHPEYVTEQAPEGPVTEGVVHITRPSEYATAPAVTEEKIPEDYVTETSEGKTKKPELVTEQASESPVTEVEHATGTTSKPSDLVTEHAVSEEVTPSVHATESIPHEENVPEYTEVVVQPTEHPELVTEEAPEGQVTERVVHITGTPSQPSELVTEPEVQKEETPEVHVTEGLPHEERVTEVSAGVTEKPKPVTEEIPGAPTTEGIEHETDSSPKPSEYVPEHVTHEEQTPTSYVTESIPPSEHVPEHTEGIVPSTEHAILTSGITTEGQATEGDLHIISTEPGLITVTVTEQAVSVTKQPLEIQGSTAKPSELVTEQGVPEEQTSIPHVTVGVTHEHVPEITEGSLEATEQPDIVTKQPSEGLVTEEIEPVTGISTKPAELVTEGLPEQQTPSETGVPHEEHIPEATEIPSKATEQPEHITKQPSEGAITEGTEHPIPEKETPAPHVTEKIPEEEHVPEATGQPELATEQAPEGVGHVTGTVTEGVEHETGYPSIPITEGVPHKEEEQITEEVTGYPNTTPVKSFEYEDHTTSKPSEGQVTMGVEYATGLPGHETELPGAIEHITSIPPKPSEVVTEPVIHEEVTHKEGQVTVGAEHTTGYPSDYGTEPPKTTISEKVPEEEESLKPEIPGGETVTPSAEGGKPTEPSESAQPEEGTEKETVQPSVGQEATTLSPSISHPTVSSAAEEGSTSYTSPQPSDLLINETSGLTTPSAHYPHVTEPVAESSTAAPDFAEQSPEIPDYHLPQEEEYEEEEQGAFGPGTCRYGGKVYVSAQQIPRDDPCDFCFCFRSDIICLQQSCPPPIPRCHEEPIRGFCCPRYECPVSMATTVNITTTTTTTTTTLPPHFFSHAYKGRATRQGCQIQGQAYQVGEDVPSASGPCLQCKCGGNGQMKCDPKACSPEPMLRKMIAEVASRRRR